MSKGLTSSLGWCRAAWARPQVPRTTLPWNSNIKMNGKRWACLACCMHSYLDWGSLSQNIDLGSKWQKWYKYGREREAVASRRWPAQTLVFIPGGPFLCGVRRPKQQHVWVAWNVCQWTANLAAVFALSALYAAIRQSKHSVRWGPICIAGVLTHTDICVLDCVCVCVCVC